MKKVIFMFLSLVIANCMAACSDISVSENESNSDEKTYYSVTFVQNGQPDVVKTVEEGENLTDIPSVKSETGYDIVWDVTDFSTVTSSTTVNAVKTAKSFVINYELGTVSGDSHAQIIASSQNVKYGDTFNLFAPSCDGYIFKGWAIKDTETTFENGTYTLTDNVTLVAVWEKDFYDDRWYTKYY